MHETFRQNVEDCAGRVGDVVERELRPLQRAIVLDGFRRQSGLPKGRKNPVVSFAADRREGDAAGIRRMSGTVAVAFDRYRQRASDDGIGTERGGQLLLVSDAVLRTQNRGLVGIRERALERFDRAVGIVRFDRNDRELCGDRLDVLELAWRVDDLVADFCKQIAKERSDRAFADDVDFQ